MVLGKITLLPSYELIQLLINFLNKYLKKINKSSDSIAKLEF